MVDVAQAGFGLGGGGGGIDIIALILVIGVMLFFAMFASAALVLWLYQRELAIIPRKKYEIDIFNRDKATNKDVLNRTLKGWMIKRKGVQWLRLSFDAIMAGADLDAGYTRTVKRRLNEKGKPVDYIELREKIPGVKDASNFEPLELAYEVDANVERDIRKNTVALSELSQKLVGQNFKELNAEDQKKYKEAFQTLTGNINENLDRVIDHDRRLQAAQVSGWGELTATGIEKAGLRVQREDPLLKYAPYLAMIVVAFVLLGVTLLAADLFSKTTNSATGQVVGACQQSMQMFTTQAKACGWVPQTAADKAAAGAPAGVPAPGG